MKNKFVVFFTILFFVSGASANPKLQEAVAAKFEVMKEDLAYCEQSVFPVVDQKFGEISADGLKYGCPNAYNTNPKDWWLNVEKEFKGSIGPQKANSSASVIAIYKFLEFQKSSSDLASDNSFVTVNTAIAENKIKGKELRAPMLKIGALTRVYEDHKKSFSYHLDKVIQSITRLSQLEITGTSTCLALGGPRYAHARDNDLITKSKTCLQKLKKVQSIKNDISALLLNRELLGDHINKKYQEANINTMTTVENDPKVKKANADAYVEHYKDPTEEILTGIQPAD